jgi:8-oxo-dGTP pyrophosphatase MutT (NUDIX family)
LPYRIRDDGPVASIEVLLVTSRGTGRWVVPKGNVGKREAPYVAAAREALEEAGVAGAISALPLGNYVYCKILRSGVGIRAKVQVYPLAVTDELREWAEAGERTRQWFSQSEAADLVDEPDLGNLIRSFRA